MKYYLVQYSPFDSDFWRFRMFPESQETEMKQFAKDCKEKDSSVRIFLCERIVKEYK